MSTPRISSPVERRALLKVLGVDVTRLDLQSRAALEALSEEVIALREEAEDMRQALKEARLLADNDALCPIFNRRAFEREIRREIALAGRFRTPLSLIFIDLDNFKKVNDVYGHAAGDEVLVTIAEMLTANTRETDVVGRLGGDEFGILLAHANISDSFRKAEQIERMLDEIVVTSNQKPDAPAISLGASCGVVEWRPGQDASSMISEADENMFAQKARRKGQSRSFE